MDVCIFKGFSSLNSVISGFETKMIGLGYPSVAGAADLLSWLYYPHA